MLVALATRWPWVSAFIWFKPSVFPFALIGIRDRRWWIVTAGFALSTVLLWPMVRDWIVAVLNAGATTRAAVLPVADGPRRSGDPGDRLAGAARSNATVAAPVVAPGVAPAAAPSDPAYS